MGGGALASLSVPPAARGGGPGGRPEDFRARCEGLIIRVEDFPDEEIAAEMELESTFELLGLYQGISHVERSVMEAVHMPDMARSEEHTPELQSQFHLV